MPSSRSAGRQPTTYVGGSVPPSCARLASTATGSMPCGSKSPWPRSSSPTSSTVTSPGLSVAGQRVDDHQRVVPVEQVVGQVHATDAVVDGAHVLGQASGRARPPDDLGPEPVVAEEQVADPGNQDRRLRSVTRSGSHLRIFRYRLMSGIERIPTTATTAATTTATTTVVSDADDSHDRLSSRGLIRVGSARLQLSGAK